MLFSFSLYRSLCLIFVRLCLFYCLAVDLSISFFLSVMYSLLQALNEGELSSHRMDEIWSSFGAELTEVSSY
jgi:hypothetical protein